MNGWMNNQEFTALTQGAKVLERDRYGVKVCRLSDGRIMKLFRIKRLLSLSFVYPYSVRFLRNAQRLQARGIATVNVDRVFFQPGVRRHGVIYGFLDGKDAGSLIKGSDAEQVIRQLAGFMALLHEKGVYFRSLHPGNVICLEGGGMGLIDIGDMRFHRGKLTLDERNRNFRHLFRRAEYKAALLQFGYAAFIDCYLRSARLSKMDADKLKLLLMKNEQRWTGAE